MAKKVHRVLFYSHDTFGLGHIRRTLALCDTVATTVDDVSVLVLSGSSSLPCLRLPPGVDYVKLPCVTKLADEHYEAKFLNLEFQDVRSLRQEIIFSVVANYAPDLVFVDNVPVGMKGEMRKTLAYLREHRRDTMVVLTFRDVLDEPSHVISNWRSQAVYDAIDRFYDHILVYGMREVFDVVREYQMPEAVARKLRYAGYIRREPERGASTHIRQRLAPHGQKLVLVTVGGGGDGYPIVNSFLTGLATSIGLEWMRTFVVLGPEMPDHLRQDVKARFEHVPGVTFADFCEDLTAYVAASDAVLSMGGYNTICEILSQRRPAVIVPRVQPRREQWIRSSRLAKLGLVRSVHPSDATPERLVQEVLSSLDTESASAPMMPLAFEGLHSLSALLSTHVVRPS
jgi:predicted glycosyltransferase